MRKVKGLKVNEKFLCIKDLTQLPGYRMVCNKDEKLEVIDFYYTMDGKILNIKFDIKEKEIRMWKHQFHSHFKKIFRFGK